MTTIMQVTMLLIIFIREPYFNVIITQLTKLIMVTELKFVHSKMKQ